MQTITIKENQTLYDIALEQYGTCEAVGELLQLNAQVANDPAALRARGIDSIADDAFYLDIAVESDTQMIVNSDSILRQNSVVKELTTDITTYDNGTND